MADISTVKTDELSFTTLQANVARALLDETLDKFDLKRFEELLNKDFIRHLINRNDIKIDVEMRNTATNNKGLFLIIRGDEAHTVLQACLQETNPVDKKYIKILNFFFVVAYEVNIRINSHPLRKHYIRSFLKYTYFEIKRSFILTRFDDNIQSGLYVPIEPALIIPAMFHTNEAKTFWQAINHCFHETIFFDHLTLEFLSFSKDLRTRYLELVYSHRDDSRQILLDHLADIYNLRKLLGSEMKDQIATGVWQIVKHKEYGALVLEIDDNEEKFIFTIRYVVQQYLSRVVADVEPLFTAIAVLATEYHNFNKLYPFEPSIYIIAAVQTVSNVFDICQRRNIPAVMSITNSLVHMLGVKLLNSIKDIPLSLDNYGDFMFNTQMWIDVVFYIDKTSRYVHKPNQNETFTDLLECVNWSLTKKFSELEAKKDLESVFSENSTNSLQVELEWTPRE